MSPEAPHSYDPATGFPRVMPSLRYDDVGAALEWLTAAFGLAEHLRWIGPDGVVHHAELRLGDAWIELSEASDDTPSPRTLGRTSALIVAFVADVDEHCRRARAAGATIRMEPEDRPWGLRQYIAQDLEGHRWEFSRFLWDVPAAEWGATLAEPG